MSKAHRTSIEDWQSCDHRKIKRLSLPDMTMLAPVNEEEAESLGVRHAWRTAVMDTRGQRVAVPTVPAVTIPSAVLVPEAEPEREAPPAATETEVAAVIPPPTVLEADPIAANVDWTAWRRAATKLCTRKTVLCLAGVLAAVFLASVRRPSDQADRTIDGDLSSSESVASALHDEPLRERSQSGGRPNSGSVSSRTMANTSSPAHPGTPTPTSPALRSGSNPAPPSARMNTSRDDQRSVITAGPAAAHSEVAPGRGQSGPRGQASPSLAAPQLGQAQRQPAPTAVHSQAYAADGPIVNGPPSDSPSPYQVTRPENFMYPEDVVPQVISMIRGQIRR